MCNRTDEATHARFLPIMECVKRYAGFSFRQERCPHRREDCIAEAIAWAWQQFTRLEARGKDATLYKAMLAKYAVLSVKKGEGVCGSEAARDAMSEIAHQRKGFRTLTVSFLEETLRDNTLTPVPDQAAFRCDFPTFVGRQTSRDQQMIFDLAKGGHVTLIAKSYRISISRVKQLRWRLCNKWEEFCEEPAEVA